MNTHQPPENVKSDWTDTLRHTLGLFQRKKWFILGVWPLVSAAFVLAIMHFHLLEGNLAATVLIGMDKPIQIHEGDEKEDMGPKKIELIHSRNFLKEVVDRLSLRMQVLEGSRDDLFDSLWIGPKAVPGRYRLHIPPSTHMQPVLTMNDDAFGYRNHVVATARSANSVEIAFPEVYMKLNPSLFNRSEDISFDLISPRQAVDGVLNNLTIERPSGRRENYFTITLKGRDYRLTAKTVNVIADLFVRQNLGFGKRRLHEKLDLLATQLGAAKNRLSISENALRNFLTDNPTFALDRQTEQAVGDLVQQETKTLDAQNTLNDATELQTQFNQAAPEERTDIANEILMMLASKNVLRASVLQSELSRLLTEKSALARDYSKDHPLIRQNQQKTESVAVQASQSLNDFIQDLYHNTVQNKSTTSTLSSRLRNLPQKSLRLAELRRTQQTDAESYSLLMSRYNQAKVEDAVEISDVFVMDYAVEPLAMPPFIQLLLAVLLGALIGAAFTAGPVILSDFYRKTAYTEIELAGLTDLPFMESIPVIKPSSRAVRASSSKRCPLLITEEISPDYTKEVFRSLRTKILLNLYGLDNKSIIITSLDSGAGKSLMAANLAIAFARHGIRPLLVDGDLRLGFLHRLFGLSPQPGLSDFLMGENENPMINLIQQTHVPDLCLMSSGSRVLDSAEWLTLGRMKDFLATALKTFEIIILDTPPLGAAADAVVIQELFSRFLIVVRAGKSNIKDLNDRIDEFPPVKAKIAGLILNRARRDHRFKYFTNSPYLNMPKPERSRSHARD